MQECRWRDGGFPNGDGRLVVYVGEMRGVYDPGPRNPELVLLFQPYGSGACEQTTLRPSPAIDWDSCIVGEGMCAGILVVVVANYGGLIYTARYIAERCLQCSDLVLGPIGTFVFLFGWVHNQFVGFNGGGTMPDECSILVQIASRKTLYDWFENSCSLTTTHRFNA